MYISLILNCLSDEHIPSFRNVSIDLESTYFLGQHGTGLWVGYSSL